MRIACPDCHGHDIARTRRRSMFDQIQAHFGRWPYVCRACGRRFRAGQRQPSRVAAQRGKEGAGSQSEPAGPRMAFRADPSQPTAKIVLHTETHAQMNEILLALSRAVESHKAPVKHYAPAGTR